MVPSCLPLFLHSPFPFSLLFFLPLPLLIFLRFPPFPSSPSLFLSFLHNYPSPTSHPVTVSLPHPPPTPIFLPTSHVNCLIFSSSPQGGVILVSHDARLIKMICKELWVCGNQTIKTLEGGIEEYRKIVEAELAAQ